MNHFSYEMMGKEKVRDLQEEGMRSQAVYRSGAPKFSFLLGLPKFILGLLGILGILGLLAR
jgi:hypothetical protein